MKTYMRHTGWMVAALLASTPGLGDVPGGGGGGGAEKPSPRPSEQPQDKPTAPAPVVGQNGLQQNDLYYGATVNDPLGFLNFSLSGDPKNSLGASIFKSSIGSLTVGFSPTLNISSGSLAIGVSAGVSVIVSGDLVIYVLPPRKAGDIQFNFRTITAGGYVGLHTGMGDEITDFVETVDRLDSDPMYATQIAERFMFSMGMMDLNASFNP